MARRGGYGRDVEGIEWAKLGAGQDALGKLSAAGMGQTYFAWLNDAVAFHVHYCERYQLHQQYRQDQEAAAQQNRPTVDPHDPKYHPQGPRPTVTLRAAGQGSAAGKSPSQSR